MAAPPLTHHDILGLIEPFSRRERHVDLAASDRAERLLRFKPIDRDGGARETLQLDVFATQGFRLTRTPRLRQRPARDAAGGPATTAPRCSSASTRSTRRSISAAVPAT